MTIALFARSIDARRRYAGLSFPSAWFRVAQLFLRHSADAVLRLVLDARGALSAPRARQKFALGLAFLSASFLLMVPAAMLTAEDASVRCGWSVSSFCRRLASSCRARSASAP